MFWLNIQVFIEENTMRLIRLRCPSIEGLAY